MEKKGNNQQSFWKIFAALGGVAGVVAICGLAVAVLQLAQAIASDEENKNIALTQDARTVDTIDVLKRIEVLQATQAAHPASAIGTAIAAEIQILEITRQASDGAVAVVPTVVATQITQPTALPIPDTPIYTTINWQGQGDYNSQNLELPSGASELFGIPFLTGWTLTTSSGSIQNPASYTFDVNVPNPAHVYVLIQSGWGYNQFANKQIGYIRLEYQDGTLTDVPLVLGYNIRDWVREPNHTVSVITATSPDLQEAWRGRTVAGQLGGIDLLTIQIPTTKQNSTLRSVSFVDTTETTTSSLDPAMHIVGMTIESRTR